MRMHATLPRRAAAWAACAPRTNVARAAAPGVASARARWKMAPSVAQTPSMAAGEAPREASAARKHDQAWNER